MREYCFLFARDMPFSKVTYYAYLVVFIAKG